MPFTIGLIDWPVILSLASWFKVSYKSSVLTGIVLSIWSYKIFSIFLPSSYASFIIFLASILICFNWAGVLALLTASFNILVTSSKSFCIDWLTASSPILAACWISWGLPSFIIDIKLSLKSSKASFACV